MNPDGLIPLVDNACPNKCPAPLILAQDYAHYATVVSTGDDNWSVRHDREEPLEEEMSVRLFCSHCSTYFHVPEALI